MKLWNKLITQFTFQSNITVKRRYGLFSRILATVLEWLSKGEDYFENIEDSNVILEI